MPTASSPHAPLCPLSMAPRCMMALRALEVQICVLTCSCALSACFPLVSGDRAHRECSGITDTPVTLPNRIMETYWFFSQPLTFFFSPTHGGSWCFQSDRPKAKTELSDRDPEVSPATWQVRKDTPEVKKTGGERKTKCPSIINQSITRFLGLGFHLRHCKKERKLTWHKQAAPHSTSVTISLMTKRICLCAEVMEHF